MSYRIHTEKSWHATTRELGDAFRRWGVAHDEWELIPAAEPTRRDPQGIRLVYTLRGQEVRLEMSNQDTGRDNLRVLYLAVEAMRLNEARGLGDVVQSAYLQLAAPAKVRDPYEVLGVRPDSPPEVIEAAHRALAKRHHPDAGGSVEAMKEINAALERVQLDRAS